MTTNCLRKTATATLAIAVAVAAAPVASADYPVVGRLGLRHPSHDRTGSAFTVPDV